MNKDNVWNKVESIWKHHDHQPHQKENDFKLQVERLKTRVLNEGTRIIVKSKGYKNKYIELTIDGVLIISYNWSKISTIRNMEWDIVCII
jgi:hypothetical protein